MFFLNLIVFFLIVVVGLIDFDDKEMIEDFDLYIIIGVVLGVFLIFIFLILMFIWFRRCKFDVLVKYFILFILMKGFFKIYLKIKIMRILYFCFFLIG